MCVRVHARMRARVCACVTVSVSVYYLSALSYKLLYIG